MKIEELSKFGIDEYYIEKFKGENVNELYPPQADIVRKNLLDDKNIVISIPTAAGKTLMASLGIIKKFSGTRCKAIYIAPMVALANEKFNYFRELFGGRYKVSMSVGDFDSDDSWLERSDIIVCTPEKLDSLTRHQAKWLGQVGLIIVDEIHTMNDAKRGPTLEVLLTKLRQITPRAQTLSLSATIANSKELAEWLGAGLYVSDFRPSSLHEGIYYDNKLQFTGHKDYKLNEAMEIEASIMKNTLELNKQSLFFVSSRRNAESLAERLSSTISSQLTEKENKDLEKLSNDILEVLESPTKQCQRIALCVKGGTAFHHAGLMKKQKTLIEDGFRNGIIKVITSTPTLAMGVNLPAFRVVIRDCKRYTGGYGMNYIPVMEYRQMAGRAGRPRYDKFGEAILIAKTDDEAYELTERFINGDVEEIRSKLAVQPILRMHTLALVASSFAKTEGSVLEFFAKTFYSFQYGNETEIEEKISEIIGELVEWGFIEYENGKLNATKVGKRVSELYLDPLTAHKFVESLNRATDQFHDTFSYLHIISTAKEMEPKLNPGTREAADIGQKIIEKNDSFLEAIPDEWDLEYDDFIRSLKTASLLEAWVEEKTDDQILNEFRVAPGEMRTRIQTADWLVYSLQEMSNLLGHKSLLNEIRKTRVRLDYGIKEELVALVKLEGVGRVRARKLFRNDLKTLNDLRKVPVETLSKVVGKRTANSIKKQVGIERLVKN